MSHHSKLQWFIFIIHGRIHDTKLLSTSHHLNIRMHKHVNTSTSSNSIMNDYFARKPMLQLPYRHAICGIERVPDKSLFCCNRWITWHIVFLSTHKIPQFEQRNAFCFFYFHFTIDEISNSFSAAHWSEIISLYSVSWMFGIAVLHFKWQIHKAIPHRVSTSRTMVHYHTLTRKRRWKCSFMAGTPIATRLRWYRCGMHMRCRTSITWCWQIGQMPPPWAILGQGKW